MRADAQRSYDRLLVAAEQVFSEQGTDASLNEVAKRANVGPGTLYRHFPNRDELIGVLMTDWVERLQAAADQATTRTDPREVLCTWFRAFVDQISVHRGGPQRITAALTKTGSPIADKANGLLAANESVLERLRAAGVLREGIDSVQVCRLVGGVAAAADQASLDSEAVDALLAIVANGLLVD